MSQHKVLGEPGAYERSQPSQRRTQPPSRAERIAGQHPATLTFPTLDGDVDLTVGSVSYGIPQRSRVMRHATQPVAYVLTPAGGVHVLTERGELQVDEATRRWIRDTHFSKT